MKIRLRLTLAGKSCPADFPAEFELTGNAWTSNTRKLVESAGDASGGDGCRSMTRRLANIDPALVDDFRRTL